MAAKTTLDTILQPAEQSGSEWRLELLGSVRLLREGQELPHFKTRRMTLLLARLACSPDRAHPRDVLAEELWPDEDPDAVRERFRQTLALLRRELERGGAASGSVLIADRSTVRLAAHGFSTDAVEFEAVCRRALREATSARQIALLQQAVALYRGELLPGFYEDWILTERGHLEELHRQALCRLTSALAESGQASDAVTVARQAANADPLSEEAHCALIRLLAQTGRAGDAQRQYHKWICLLRDEVGAEPGEAVKNLMAQVSSGTLPPLPSAALTPSPAPDAPPPTPFAAILPASPPPVLSTLPASLTRFFGRDEEIGRLVSLLMPAALLPAQSREASPCPLVTLIGPGGAGKTRLALEAARRLCAVYSGAAWFVPLADIAHPDLIADAIREALALPRSAQAAPLEQVVEYLHGHKSALLVLDNFEHLQTETLQAEATGLVQTLRRRLPHLACLVTSRHKLNLEGERDLLLLPLATPDAPKTPQQLQSYPSIQLFLDRARAARYSFELTPDNADAVSLLGQKLEGIPLAIELAAAWAATLTPEQILARLSCRFDLLVSRRSDVPRRHQSLQAVLEGSYQQLPPRLQRLYAQLSVFRGGWTLEAAEQIAGAHLPGTSEGLAVEGEAVKEETAKRDAVPSGHVLDGLALLQERSFLQAEERGTEMRYRLLESLREFGAEQLAVQEKFALARRHADCFLALAQEAQKWIRTPDEKRWFDRLEAEHDNLRAALEWAEQNDTETALKLAVLLAHFWMTRGYASEGGEWLRRILAQSGPMSLPRAHALNALALMRLTQGQYSESETLARESLAALGTLDDPVGMTKALNTLGAILMEQGNYDEAQARYEECLSLCRTAKNRQSEATVLVNLGNLVYARGEYERACAYYGACLEARRALGDRRGVAVALDHLGRALREQGDYVRACDLHNESLVMQRELKDRHNIAASLCHLAAARMCIGEHGAARAPASEGMTLYRELGDRAGVAEGLSLLGEIACLEHDEAHARACWLESLDILMEAGDKSGVASLLEAFAGLAQSDAQQYDAAQMLGLADAIRAEISHPIRPSMRTAYERTLSTTQAVLGEARFAQAWTTGRALTWEQATRLCSPTYSLA